MDMIRLSIRRHVKASPFSIGKCGGPQLRVFTSRKVSCIVPLFVMACTPYDGTSRELIIAFDIGTTYSGRAAFAFLQPGEVPRITVVTRCVPLPASTVPFRTYYDERETDTSKTQRLCQPNFLLFCTTTRMGTSEVLRTEKGSRRTKVFFNYDGSSSSNIRLPRCSYPQEGSTRARRTTPGPVGSNE